MAEAAFRKCLKARLVNHRHLCRSLRLRTSWAEAHCLKGVRFPTLWVRGWRRRETRQEGDLSIVNLSVSASVFLVPGGPRPRRLLLGRWRTPLETLL